MRPLCVALPLAALAAAAATALATCVAPASADTAPPAIQSLSPSSGPASGGTTVTIGGVHLGGATAVTFGGKAARSFQVSADETSITAVAPAGSGTADVAVTTAAGTSASGSAARFRYLPVVTGLAPSSGSVSGGTEVTITGAGFTGATAVRFGSKSAVDLTVESDSRITATAPEGGGSVDVTVTGPTGTSGAESYDYALAVSGVSAGPGGGQVTLTGIGFAVATRVRAGSSFAGFAVVSDTTMIVVVPGAATGGTARVTVETPYGTTTPVDAPLPAAGSPVSPTVTGGSFFGGSGDAGGKKGGGKAVFTVRLLGRPQAHVAGRTAVFTAAVGVSGPGSVSVSLLDASGRQVAQIHRTANAAGALQVRLGLPARRVVRGALYRLAFSGSSTRVVSTLFKLR